MLRSKRRPLLVVAMLAAFAASSVSAATLNARSLFVREEICGGNANLSQCTDSGLPDNFCCGKTDTCLLLAGKTTVLCCPAGSSCASINPIVCDLGLQDASQNPGAAVKTTVLNGKLETCGTGCCPYGYRCENGACKRNADQSQPPAGANPAPSSTTATTKSSSPTSTPKPSTTGSSGAPATTSAVSNDDTQSTEQSGTPVGAIIGGVVAAILAIAALIGLLVWLRKRKNKKNELEHHDTTSSFGNTIVVSAPQPIDGYPTMRQDFLAKSSTKNSMASSTLGSPFAPSFGSGRPSPKFSQPYSRPTSDEVSQSDARSYHHSAEIGALRNGARRNLTSDPFTSPPRTPENKARQESGGSGNINIYVEGPSPPGSSRSKMTSVSTKARGAPARPPAPGGGFLGIDLGVPGQRDTTWSNVLHGAGGLPDSSNKRWN